METFNVKILYCYKFMSHCLPIYAFYTLLFLERNMNLSAIAVLISLWSAFSILFEIPSGVLADRWNRRNMLVVAALVEGVCFFIWSFSDSFALFALGFFFWAIGNAFVSGTEESLIYDNLKSDGLEDQFSTVYGRSRFFANIGNLVGIAASGVLVTFISIEKISLLSAGICLFNTVLASRLRERNYYASQLNKTAIAVQRTAKDAIQLFRENQSSLLILAFLILFASIVTYLDEFDALVVNDFKVDTYWVSVFLTMRFIFISIGDLLAPIIDRKWQSFKLVFLLYGLGGIFLAVFSALWRPYAIAVFGLAMMVMSISELLFIKSLQEVIEDEGRATVMSFYGAGQNVIMIFFSLIYGLLTKLVTIQTAYLLFSVYAMVGATVFFLVFSLIKKTAVAKGKQND